jgi:hypothetical protein
MSLNPWMDFFALVSSEARETVEIYSSWEQAEIARVDAVRDEPEWETVLSVERIRFDGLSWN